MTECKKNNNKRLSNFKPSLRGRLGRIDYLSLFIFWNSITFLFFTMGLVTLLAQILSIPVLENFTIRVFAGITLVAIILYFLSHLWAITVRRLHDINLSAWWAAFLFIPFIFENWLFFTTILPGVFLCKINSSRYFSCTNILNLNTTTLEWIYAATTFALIGFCCLIIFFLPGTARPNRFGEVMPKSKKRLSFLILRATLMLLIAALPSLIMACFIIIIGAMSNWHC